MHTKKQQAKELKARLAKMERKLASSDFLVKDLKLDLAYI